MITHLPRVIAEPADRPAGADADHPMRVVTRQVAFEPDGWTPTRAAKVAALFNDLAPDWNTRDGIGRFDPLVDALDRGAVSGDRCVEVGSGTGLATRHLSDRFGSVVAVDLAYEMLSRAPAELAARVLADAACLPLPAGSVDALVLANALLFPFEADRVLAPGGAVVWANSLGDRTPIHLSADEVVAALPGSWHAQASEAGWGTWCVARRAT